MLGWNTYKSHENSQNLKIVYSNKARYVAGKGQRGIIEGEFRGDRQEDMKKWE